MTLHYIHIHACKQAEYIDIRTYIHIYIYTAIHTHILLIVLIFPGLTKECQTGDILAISQVRYMQGLQPNVNQVRTSTMEI